MKRVFALLALVGAVTFGAPAWAEEKGAEPTPAVAEAPAGMSGMAAAVPALVPAAAEASPAAAPAPVPIQMLF